MDNPAENAQRVWRFRLAKRFYLVVRRPRHHPRCRCLFYVFTLLFLLATIGLEA